MNSLAKWNELCRLFASLTWREWLRNLVLSAKTPRLNQIDLYFRSAEWLKGQGLAETLTREEMTDLLAFAKANKQTHDLHFAGNVVLLTSVPLAALGCLQFFYPDLIATVKRDFGEFDVWLQSLLVASTVGTAAAFLFWFFRKRHLAGELVIFLELQLALLHCGRTASLPLQARPNPSVEARPSAIAYHPPVGPDVPPSAPPHLER